MKKTIVFFDSDCIMCSSFARIIFKYDKNGTIYFSALNSEYYKSAVQNLVPDVPAGTVVYYKNKDELFYQSEAVFQIIKQLKFPFSILIVFNMLPKFILDSAYQFIAANRKKWFGDSNKKCSLIQSEFAVRLIK